MAVLGNERNCGSYRAWWIVLYVVFRHSDGNGDYYCYGVVKNYNNSTARAIIQGHLQTMYNNGQRKLQVMVFHLRSPGNACTYNPAATGDAMDSDLSNFDHQYITNLKDYLSYASSIGFDEFVVLMSPLSLNWPGLNWGKRPVLTALIHPIRVS